jgi:PAS domain-containing protein
MTGATIWIFLSDALLADFISPESSQWFSTAKGIFFVAVTTVFLILALRTVPDNKHTTNLNSFSDRLANVLTHENVPKDLAYLPALVFPTLALLLRSTIPVAWHDPMLELFMLPIILSALIGGLGPGLVSTTITGILVAFVAYGVQNPALFSSTTLLSLGFLLLNGILVSILSGSLRQSVFNMKHNQSLLDTVINGTSDAIFVKDTEGRYLLANPVIGAFLGQSVESVIGKTDAETRNAH